MSNHPNEKNPNEKNKNNNDDEDDNHRLVTHRLPSEDGPLVGALAITAVLACMGLGPLLPGIVLVLAYVGYMRTAATLAAVILASMLLFAEHSPRWCRFYLKAASYFERGVYLHVTRDVLMAMQHCASMWCMHPHGTAFGFGFSLNGAIRFRAEREERYVPDELLRALGSKQRLRAADGVQAPILFYIPLLRSVLYGFGCCTPATKQGMLGLLTRRIDFGIMPGGMEEVALYVRGRERVYLTQRAGFIKYALQHGYVLLPAYTFGECDLYQSMTLGARWRLWVQKHHGFIVPIFWGPLWYAPWLPRRNVPIHTVLGSPVQLPRIERPTEEEIRHWHQRYVAALTELFDTHKEQFGYGDRELEVV